VLDRKYRLVRLLGQGGMGSVYEAEHDESQQRVAVKLIQGGFVELYGDSEAVRRFRREARAAGAADSEHIVQVLDAGEDEDTGQLYLVMEYLQGEDLQQFIDRLGPLEPDVALRIAAQALAGLQKAHEAGVVHRDIKPANLFLARGEGGAVTVKILDFGIAKIRGDPLHALHTTELTHSGKLLGSPMYMSPEQVMSCREVDHRADLWCLASALYCALAGHPPHAFVSPVGRLLYTICSAPPPPLHGAAPWVPDRIAEVVHRALRLDPGERYPSAAAMLGALRPLLSGGTGLDERMLAPVSPAVREAAVQQARARRPRRVDPEEDTRPQGTMPAGSPDRGPTRAPPASDGERGGAGPEYGDTVPIAPPVRDLPAPQPRERQAGPAAPEGAARRTARVSSVAVIAVVVSLSLGVAVADWISGEGPLAMGSPPPALVPLHMVYPTIPTPVAPEPRTVSLEVLPGDAHVDVEGVPATVSGGLVYIEGALGSVHHVRARKGASSIEANVSVTELGAQPPTLELPSPRDTSVAPTLRAATPGSTSAAAETTPAPPTTTAEPATPAPSDAVERIPE